MALFYQVIPCLFHRICSSHWPVVWWRSVDWKGLDHQGVVASLSLQHSCWPGPPCAHSSSTPSSVSGCPHVLQECPWWLTSCQHSNNVMQGKIFMQVQYASLHTTPYCSKHTVRVDWSWLLNSVIASTIFITLISITTNIISAITIFPPQ